MSQSTRGPAGLIDLASARFGGRVVVANDEFFGAKERLIVPDEPVWIPDRYTEHGKWMDGWETRRRREPGHDWCVVRLGLPGRVRELTVDTAHFMANQPEACSIEASSLDVAATPEEVCAGTVPWTEILPRTTLEPNRSHGFPLQVGDRWTHLKLHIYPDGGVARLRAWGEVIPDWAAIGAGNGVIDLVGVRNGGRPMASSDEFYGEALNLIRPDEAVSMSDGWETRRRRGPGHDWVVFALGHAGIVDEVVVDTAFFKGNYPDRCSLDGCDLSEQGPLGVDAASLSDDSLPWFELLPVTKLGPDRRHSFREELASPGRVSHVRLNAFPDGGVSRLRVLGRLA